MAEEVCPIKKSLDMIGGKWKLRIIYQIGMETRRYGELKKMIPEISEKMLIQELKSLVDYNILARKIYHEVPPRVEYTLTPKGLSALPLIELMREFGTQQ